MILQFQHRVEAGQQLAKRLAKYDNRSEAIVIALTPGGAVVGYEVARALNLSFDLLAVAKQGEIAGRTVLLVDDGIDTGGTMMNAIEAVRSSHAGHIVVATPTAPLASIRTLRREVDEILAVMLSADFVGVSQCYEDFPEVSEEELQELLIQAGPVEHAGA